MWLWFYTQQRGAPAHRWGGCWGSWVLHRQSSCCEFCLTSACLCTKCYVLKPQTTFLFLVLQQLNKFQPVLHWAGVAPLPWTLAHRSVCYLLFLIYRNYPHRKFPVLWSGICYQKTFITQFAFKLLLLQFASQGAGCVFYAGLPLVLPDNVTSLVPCVCVQCSADSIHGGLGGWTLEQTQFAAHSSSWVLLSCLRLCSGCVTEQNSPSLLPPHGTADFYLLAGFCFVLLGTWSDFLI